MGQSNLLKNLIEFNEKSIPRTTEGKEKNRTTFERLNALHKFRELILNAL